MITFPGPCSAVVSLPVTPNREGIVRVLTLERAVVEALPGLRTTIPAFNRLLIEGVAKDWDPDLVRALVGSLVERCLTDAISLDESATVLLPVCYDVALAPDLEEVARLSELTVDEVASIHSGAVYTVLATGFAPGFAYLGDLDDRLAIPRRSSPRPRVEAGAVGIADRRTGVYPSSGPGGWHLIGRVPPSFFTNAEQRLARFEPGGAVEFRLMGRDEYEAAVD